MIDNILNFDIPAKNLYDIAVKNIDKNNLINALLLLRRAKEKEPDNLEIYLSLANVYSDLGLINKSNAFGYYAFLQGDKLNAECTYLLATNFLKLNDFEQGLLLLKHFSKNFPNHEDIYNVYDMISNIENGVYGEYKREAHMIKLCERGKSYIEKGNYKNAVRLFSLLNKVEPDVTYIQNNMALSNFYNKNQKTAISISKTVLSRNPYDVFAVCNLTIFYFKSKDQLNYKMYLKKMENIKTHNSDEIFKICATYCELKLHEKAIIYLRQMQNISPYDKKVLLLLATANYNVGNILKAIELWSDVLKIDDYCYVAYFYKRLAQKENKPEKIEYSMQLPFIETVETINKIREYLKMSSKELVDLWINETEFKMILIWALEFGEFRVKSCAIMILGNINNFYSQDILREILLNKHDSDIVKEEVLTALNKIGAKEPYAAFYAGKYVEVKVTVEHKSVKDLSKRDKDVIGIIKSNMSKRCSSDAVILAVNCWINIAQSTPFDEKFNNLKTIAAVVEFLTFINMGKKVTKKEVCEIYNTSLTTFNKYLKLLEETDLFIKK